MGDSVIARHPPNDGSEWGAQCARCGSSVVHYNCGACGGVGYIDDIDDIDDGARHEVECPDCDGDGGGGEECGSGAEWCEAHPMPGREGVAHGKVEWFVIERREVDDG